MAKLSDKQIQLAKTTDKDEFLSDGAGLYLRVRTSGQKIWLYRYKVENKTRWFDLGLYPALSLKSARAEAARISADRQNGIDPVEQRNEEANKQHVEKAKKAARLTVEELYDRWEKLELKNRKDKGAEARRSFTKDLFPFIGDIPAADVTRVMIAQILDTVALRGAQIVARNMLGDIRQMFGFAIVRGIVENDPTSHMKRDDFGRKVERERILSEDEIKTLHARIPSAKLQETTAIGIWLMLSTCCRVGELSRARWENIDIENKKWRIPPDNAKNGKEHTIYFSDFSAKQFQKLKEITGSSAWCNPAEKKENTHLCLKSITKQVHARQRDAKTDTKSRIGSSFILSGGEWTPHDLRRTGATMMGNLGVRPDVIEKCLNHVEQNRLVRIYQRQKLEEEQRAAWKLLGEHVDMTINGFITVSDKASLAEPDSLAA